MLKRSLSVALLVAGAPSVVAGTVSQTVPFDYDAEAGVTFPVLQGFDTLGGTRQLTGATFEFDHNFELELYLESTGPTALSADDFALDVSYFTLFQLGTGDDPPFFGAGALFVDDVSGDLAAYDGVPGNDGADSFRTSATRAFTVTQAFGPADPAFLNAVTDVGPLTTVFGGFMELFFEWFNPPDWPFPPGGVPEYPDDAAVWVSVPHFRHFGEIVITYEFVPEPATALPLAGLALLARRRR